MKKRMYGSPQKEGQAFDPKGRLAADLMAHRFHPRYADKWKDWGHEGIYDDTNPEDVEYQKTLREARATKYRETARKK